MISSLLSSTPSRSAILNVSAISDSGIPYSRSIVCRYSVAPLIAAFSASVSTASPHIGCSSLGGPGNTTTVGLLAGSRGGTTSPGAVPIGSSMLAPSGITACLRLLSLIASISRFGQRFASG